MLNWKKEIRKIYDASWQDPDPFRDISLNGIVLYGAGVMGQMAIDIMRKSNIEPRYIVDKNKSGCLNGVKIVRPGDITDKDKSTLSFIVCIASIPVTPIYDYLKQSGCLDVRHFYDMSEISFPSDMPNGWVVKNFKRKNIESVLKLIEHDDYSIANYIQFLWWRLKRKEVINPEYLVLSGKKLFKAPCIPDLSDSESFLDGGAHHGQSISSFLEKGDNKYRKMWAFEPDTENMNVLKKKYLKENINLYYEALSDKCEITAFQDGLGYASKLDKIGNRNIKTVTIDSLHDINPTIIKLHIEGNEYQALVGAKNTINKNRAIIMVLADHSSDGLFKIAEYLGKLQSYKIYFYLHDYCGNSAIYYAIPNERLRTKK